MHKPGTIRAGICTTSLFLGLAFAAADERSLAVFALIVCIAAGISAMRSQHESAKRSL